MGTEQAAVLLSSKAPESFNLNVQGLQMGGGEWERYEKPKKLMEEALARSLLRSPRDGKTPTQSQNKELEVGGAKKAVPMQAAKVGKEPAIQTIPSNSNSPHSPTQKLTATSENDLEDGTETPNTAPINNMHDQLVNIATAKVVAVQEVDEEEVMRCLGNKKLSGSGLVLDLVDFGGQAVFNVLHHLFITKYGVYLLTFNMEWLADNADPKKKEMCLSNLAFWMNSIFIHTAHKDGNGKNQTARVVFVGTRKDRVAEAGQHEHISALLESTFRTNPVWIRRMKNNHAQGRDGHVRLNFFPVDNTMGRGDTSVAALMHEMEISLSSDAVVQQRKPLTWLQMIDKLGICTEESCFLSLQKVQAIAISTGIPEEDVPSLLRFLHEMGMIMWHEDEGLRDVVILDPIKYFVEPVTRLICKHSAQDDSGLDHDFNFHHERWHEECEAEENEKWQELVTKGVLYGPILHILFRDTGREEKLTRLMLKIGLIVNFVSQSIDEEVIYLVPALLPRAGQSVSASLILTGPVNTCFLVFTISSLIMKQEYVTGKDLQDKCFLPSGLFPRLLGKAAQLRNQTTTFRRNQYLFAECAVLYYGSQRFKLTLIEQLNAIQLEVEGLHPLGVFNRLHNQVTNILSDCFGSLRFFVAVEYKSEGGAEGSLPIFMNLERVQQACAHMASTGGSNDSSNIVVDGKTVGRKKLEELYGPWVRRKELRTLYHVFFSYRWGEDSKFVTGCNDSLLMETVGAQHQAVEVFQDVRRLQSGTNFLEGFEDALISSLVIVPVISILALERMIKHDPTKEDFTLIEWILACQCYEINRTAGFKHPVVRVQRVLPILFEGITTILDEMSDVEPAVSWSKAEEALLKRRLAVAFPRCTVKALIKDHLMKLLYLSEAKFKVEGEPFEPYGVHLTAAVATCTSEICDILNELNVDQYHETAKAPATLFLTAALTLLFITSLLIFFTLRFF
jgi:hypothetical protein